VDVECFIREFLITERKTCKNIRSLLTAVHGNFPTGEVHFDFHRGRYWLSESGSYGGTAENQQPAVSVTCESFLFSGVTYMDRYLGVKQRLFSFTYGVLRVHRCNFSSDISILPAMHDHHGIRPNLKCL
ncbi:hypothetical protein MXB_2224, partial [Myxobolus squamalis]